MVKLMDASLADPRIDASSVFYTREISATGMFIEMLNPLPADRDVRISFQLPGTKEDLKVLARIVRSMSKEENKGVSGIGIEFRDMDGHTEETIRLYVEKLEGIRKKLS